MAGQEPVSTQEQRFDPGKILITYDALRAMEESYLRHGDAAGRPSEQVAVLLERHTDRDWGHHPPERWALNDRALAVGHQVSSLWFVPGSDVQVLISTVAGGHQTSISTRAEVDAAREAAIVRIGREGHGAIAESLTDPERHS